MLLELPDVLDAATTRELQTMLQHLTAGTAQRQTAAEVIETALRQHPLFNLAVRPRRFSDVRFLSHRAGDSPSPEREEAVLPGLTPMRVDIVAMVFLSDRSEYEGGQTVLHTRHGHQTVEASAGTCIAIPGSTRVEVSPVRTGLRWTAEVRVESLIRNPAEREILYDISYSRHLAHVMNSGRPEDRNTLRDCEQDLFRLWAET